MKTRILTAALAFIFSTISLADPMSGSASAAYLAQLVKDAKEQIESLHKQLSVVEQMNELQQMEVIKELTETGDSLGQMFSDIGRIERELNQWRDDPAGTKQIEHDIERMQRNIRNAEDGRGLDRGASYSASMSSLSRLKWLGKAQAKNEENIAEGTSKKKLESMSANADLSMNRILLEQEMARQRREIIATEIFSDTIGSVNYGSLGGGLANKNIK